MSTTGFKIVTRYDPALDTESMSDEEIRRFKETADFSAVHLRDDVKPTIFHCRRLKASEMTACRSETTPARVAAAAFARGLLSVSGLHRLDEEDAQYDWTRPDAERPLTTREIDASFASAEVDEIGSAIYGRSLLGKGRPAAWPQPDTSVLAVQGLGVRRAAQTLILDANSAQNKNAAEEPPGETNAG